MASISLLPLDLMQTIFSFLSVADVLFACSSVSSKWRLFTKMSRYATRPHSLCRPKHIEPNSQLHGDHRSRTSFDNRKLMWTRYGGDENEVDRVLSLLCSTESSPSTLEELELHVSRWLPLQSTKYLFRRVTSDAYPNLVSLSVNYPGYSEIGRLTSLKHLTINFLGIGSPSLPGRSAGPWVGYTPELPLGENKWVYPESCCLESLEVLQADAPETGSTDVPMSKRLCNLISLRFRGRIFIGDYIKPQPSWPPGSDYTSRQKLLIKDGDNSIDDPYMLPPKLQEIDLECWGNRLSNKYTLSHLALPPSITRVRIAIKSVFDIFPLDNLPKLADLSIFHEVIQPSYYYDSPSDRGYPLTTIPFLPALTSLHIRSRHGVREQYDELFSSMAESAYMKNLALLRLDCVPVSSHTLQRLRDALPNLEVVARTGSSVDQEQELLNARLAANLTSEPVEVQSVNKTICNTCVQLFSTDQSDHDLVCEAYAKRPCLLSSSGCRFAGTQTELRNHLKDCPFYEVKCLVCLQFISRQEHSSHTLDHQRLISQMQPHLLTYPSYQTAHYRETSCLCCEKSFATLEHLSHHECSRPNRKHLVKLFFVHERDSRRWKRFFMMGNKEALTNGFLTGLQPTDPSSSDN
jgi:hypothetical protein